MSASFCSPCVSLASGAGTGAPGLPAKISKASADPDTSSPARREPLARYSSADLRMAGWNVHSASASFELLGERLELCSFLRPSAMSFS